MRIKPAQIGRVFGGRSGHECGAFAGNMAIVVVDKPPQQSRVSAGSMVRSTAV
jgi:hypothetical protein